MIQTVAVLSAAVALPVEDVAAYVAYWSDPHRDVNLGGYICQIAERAQQLRGAATTHHGQEPDISQT